MQGKGLRGTEGSSGAEDGGLFSRMDWGYYLTGTTMGAC